MSDIIKASEVNALRELINNEVTRRGYSVNSTSATSIGTKAAAAWWEAIRLNLNKIISTSDAAASTGGSITKSQRDSLVNKAKSMYNTTVGKS